MKEQAEQFITFELWTWEVYDILKQNISRIRMHVFSIRKSSLHNYVYRLLLLGIITAP